MSGGDFQLYLSKLFWLVAEPASLLLSIWVAGCLILWTTWWRLGRLLVCLAALLSLAVAMFPLGQMALRPIEDRFPPRATLPPRIDGILVLGGVIDYYVIGKRGVPSSQLAAGSPRLDAFIELARRYPAARHGSARFAKRAGRICWPIRSILRPIPTSLLRALSVSGTI